ncbi:hypothetical protein FYJ85_01690 [Victivallaceae bacterium BBE-744-WT-12]|uniref:Uncharacterized protein n=1 Tax=Victivallis lenta TaxID=2606640 RepID=A0A844FZN9_9BACT|nr:hypothetical protein [Victivallis lenta]MST95759.1 hypothetical protein [Victivallis lenta]
MPIRCIPVPTKYARTYSQVSTVVDHRAGWQHFSGNRRQQSEICRKLPIGNFPPHAFRHQPNGKRLEVESTIILNINFEITTDPDFLFRQYNHDNSSFAIKTAEFPLPVRKANLVSIDIQGDTGLPGRDIDCQRQRIGCNRSCCR